MFRVVDQTRDGHREASDEQTVYPGSRAGCDLVDVVSGNGDGRPGRREPPEQNGLVVRCRGQPGRRTGIVWQRAELVSAEIVAVTPLVVIEVLVKADIRRRIHSVREIARDVTAIDLRKPGIAADDFAGKKPPVTR